MTLNIPPQICGDQTTVLYQGLIWFYMKQDLRFSLQCS